MHVPDIPETQPVLIAGPTASGKSAMAMAIAKQYGGVIVNADASQVYACWRILTARPTEEDEAAIPHRLYGHVAWAAPYSAGHWLREVETLLRGPDRVIIVGGTGLYFKALTEGMADIPETPSDIRDEADALTLDVLVAGLDPKTAARIDLANRARVQRAWEVWRATGKGLAQWQDETPPPLLPLQQATAFVMDAPVDWLNARIAARFDAMIDAGAMTEIAVMADMFDPSRPAFKAIGVPELMAYHMGALSLKTAKEKAVTATRQYAKRQRTWFRSQMKAWHRVSVDRLCP